MRSYPIEIPELEPTCFFCGARPIEELRNKHLQADPSIVTHVLPSKDCQIDLLGETFDIVFLPGHTPGMIGVITPDKVFYSGDAFFGAETFHKHGMLFYTDIEEALNSLQKIQNFPKSRGIDTGVFYHGGIMRDISQSATDHIKKLKATADEIFDLISETPDISFDSLTSKVIVNKGIQQSPMQFTLTKTCINAYIQYLQKNNKIELVMRDGMLVVKPAGMAPSISQIHQVKNHSVSFSISSQRKEHYLRSISSVSIEKETDSLIKISSHFNAGTQLTGDKHFDAISLMAMHFMIDVFKQCGVINNVPSTLNTTIDDLSEYRGIKLSYTDGDLDNITCLDTASNNFITQVNLFTDRFEVLIEHAAKNSEIESQLKHCLDIILAEAKVNLENSLIK